ncbi:unnamed protein product [Caenorhabditis bovis]|uniref:Uncharacterized protein n=1 Tax=Caenorhabditis bovis TaxID=2654633 RepID=A0A8S1EFV1_9PELO|nr:unnamed protein product [Caenorhabditis bovis]
MNKCSVSVELNGVSTTPNDLVKAALKTDKLFLTFRNEIGQHSSIDFEEDRNQFAPNSTSHLTTSNLISHCHFSGFSSGHRHALSLCSENDITGLILTTTNRFGIFAKDGNFYFKPYVEDNCDFGSLLRTKRAADSVIDRNPSYIREHLDGRRRYVELALVADYSIYTKYDSDEKKVNDYMQETINILNSLYHPLNIQITLVHSEIWKKGDKISVIADSKETLASFMIYKKEMLKEHLFDTGYLMTTLRFDEGVVGKAYKGTMCSYDYSGGVYVDHNTDKVETVATFAHELGHTFGMDHDPEDREVCNCPMPKCIMAPQSGHMEVWSECSVKNLASGFHRGVDLCLFNEPGKKPSEGKCGNGIVEPGEECDCGPLKCDNKCCDGSTCKLIGDAICATGDCCDLKTCKPKPRATVCRAAVGICDLDEYCNGETNDCPADFFVQNGATCPGRENEYCYEGGCGSRNDQCAKLWGPTGSGADKNCYRRNTEGNIYGNCGYNVHTNEFKKCAVEDIQCGLMHCDTQSERPIYGDPGSMQFIHNYIYSDDKVKKSCYSIKSSYIGTNQPDPGQVPDGSKCGPEDMCIGRKCQKKSKVAKVTPQCLDNCNNRGVCNNVGNCHCDRGFGGIACEIPGYGGSVNSNEAYTFRGITLSSAFILFFAALGFLIAGCCVYYRVKKNRNLLGEWWKFIKKKLDLHGELVPVRKAPPPPYAKRIRQSLTAMWGDDSSRHNVIPPGPPPRLDVPSIPMVTLKNDASSPTLLLNGNYSKGTIEKPYDYGTDSISRTGSLRPNFKPPPIPRPSEEALQMLKQELNEEKYEKLIQKPTQPPPPPVPAKLPSVKRNESFRPEVAPPPPPVRGISTGNTPPKPAIPSKPPKIAEKLRKKVQQDEDEEERIDVRSIAARFENSKK